MRPTLTRVNILIQFVYSLSSKGPQRKIECSLVLAREQGEIETLGTLHQDYNVLACEKD